MKQSKIITAYKAIEPLAKIDSLSEMDQWKLYQLRKALRPHYEFQAERETALAEKYKEFVNEEGRRIGEHAEAFIKDLNEIGNMEVDFDYEKPRIPLVRGIDFVTAESLDEFIEFVPCEFDEGE